MALIPKGGRIGQTDNKIEKTKLQIGKSVIASKILNHKIPFIESESRVQRSETQLAQTCGDKIIWNSKDLEHLEVENLRGSLDITYLRENLCTLEPSLEFLLYRDVESNATGNCRFLRQLLKHL